MPAFINLLFGERNERCHCREIMTIGRDAGNHISISDPRISRNHAMIRSVGNEQFILFDTGSRNGCFINGNRIRSPTLLHSGDIVSLGDAIITFEQVGSRPVSRVANPYSDTETVTANTTEIRSVTIAVADIRGYTSLSEKLPIQILSDVMAQWYDTTQKIIEKHDGRVDKFIGDCVMAIWEHADADATREKVLSSLRTVASICEYTGSLHDTYEDLAGQLVLGVGICTGEAAVGIGAGNTAMGDTVNLAFRLEDATKELGCDLVLDERSYRSLPRWFWERRQSSIQVKGKTGDLSVCAVRLFQLRELLDQNA